MAWRDELQPASYRGVPFSVDASELESGRRVVQHEYPQRDIPYGEDLGRKARVFSLDAYVLGADYLSAKEALLSACETQGVGVLIHPYYGSRQVLCVSVRVREIISDGGMARFSLTFNEAGQQQFPIATTDLSIAVEQSANTALESIAEQFNESFSVLKQPQFVLDQAVDFIDQTITELNAIADSVINPVADALQGLNDVGEGIESLIATPERLVGRLTQTLRALTGSLNRSVESVSTLQRLATPEIENDVVLLLTPSRQQAHRNQVALNQLMQGMALVETLRLASGVTFDSYEAATRTREQLLDLSDVFLLTVGDDVFAQMQTLQSAFSQAVPSPDNALPRLIGYTPLNTLPAVVIAYDIYGDATRAADIVLRNNITHAGFVPALELLEVLVDA